MDLIYHYTTVKLFQKILEQSTILPDKTEPNNPHEIPTTNFSSHPVWEPTRFQLGKTKAGQMILMDKQLLCKYFEGLIRIGVKPEVAPMDWFAIKEKSAMSREAIKSIYDYAIQVGAKTSQWFATFESVPEDQWETIEKFDLESNQWKFLET